MPCAGRPSRRRPGRVVLHHPGCARAGRALPAECRCRWRWLMVQLPSPSAGNVAAAGYSRDVEVLIRHWSIDDVGGRLLLAGRRGGWEARSPPEKRSEGARPRRPGVGHGRSGVVVLEVDDGPGLLSDDRTGLPEERSPSVSTVAALTQRSRARRAGRSRCRPGRPDAGGAVPRDRFEAVHDMGAARAVQPAVPDAAVLPGEFEQRLARCRSRCPGSTKADDASPSLDPARRPDPRGRTTTTTSPLVRPPSQFKRTSFVRNPSNRKNKYLKELSIQSLSAKAPPVAKNWSRSADGRRPDRGRRSGTAGSRPRGWRRHPPG